jgi:hypothetical protein
MSFMSFFDPFGSVPGSSLNWSQHAMLTKRGGTTVMAGPTIDVGRICRSIYDLGGEVRAVADAIDRLISDLDLRLDAQTELLSKQVDQLAEIANTLRNPARTRAAERIQNAFELLRHHRNERALTMAEQAIDDDPNNDVAFILAAWASLGVQDSERARGYFREAAQATASTKGVERRHMRAVRLAARLTFVLDGPEAALQELDSAAPFIDPELKADAVPWYSREDLRFACLTPDETAAFKFDKADYCTSSKQSDAALKSFRGIAADHDVSFCLMALTDPVLSRAEAIMAVAYETIRAHHALRDSIREFLPEADNRWRALVDAIERHEIQHGAAVAAQDRFGRLLDPSSPERQAFDEKLGSYPSNHWLEEQREFLATFSDFESRVAPAIEYEQMREAALENSIQQLLRQSRNPLLLHRDRLDARIGYVPRFGGYQFRRLRVDGKGNVSVQKLEATQELVARYNRLEIDNSYSSE